MPVGDVQGIVGGVSRVGEPAATTAGFGFSLAGSGRAVGGAVGVVVGLVPVGTPLPDVASDVVEGEAVGGERFYGGDSEVAVVAEVVAGKLSLPKVCQVFLLREELVAPGVTVVVVECTGGEFEFGFGGESFACPGGVGSGVVPRDMYHGVVCAACQRATGAFGLLPVGAYDLLGVAGEGIVDLRMSDTLGCGLVIGLFDKLGELTVGNGGLVEPVGVEVNRVGRTLIDGGRTGTAHHEGAAGDEDGTGGGF